MKKGYTLIELLVVVSIIGMLSMGAIVAFANFREERLSLKEATTIVSELRAAQRRAIAGDKPSGCNSVTMQGYKVVVNASSLDISAVCSGGLPATRNVIVNGVVSNPQTVTFTSLSGASATTTIQICSYSRLYSIQITGAGAVQQPTKTGSC